VAGAGLVTGGGTPGATKRQKVAVATVFVAAMFINIIDATVVNVALPTIARTFGVPVDQTATINIGFLVAVAVAIPVAGWLGDRLGAREVFVLAVGLFTLASAACGLARSVTELVVFRVVQGAAGGLMTPVGMAMLYRTFPPSERVGLGRITTVPIAFAPTIGPILGGFLTEHAGWRWIFGINVPIGTAAVAFTLLAVRPLPRTTRNRLDLAGFLLAGGGFAALMYALGGGPNQGWTSPVILFCGGLGVLLLILLAVVELRLTAPMLQLRLFTLRLFRSANLITLASSAGFLGALFVYPLMLQVAFGRSPFQAGLLTFPEALGVMTGTQVAARLYRRVGPRALIGSGQALVTVMLGCLAVLLQPDTPWFVPVLLMYAIGIGQGHTFMPAQAAAFDTVPRTRTGEATSLYNATRQAGSALGVALAATVIASVSVAEPTAVQAIAPFRWALLAAACCTMLGSLVAWSTIDNADAAPSRGLLTGPADPASA
jgi:EmrB/QacA subfamily drug resistance transporter